METTNTPINAINSFELTKRLDTIVKQAYMRRSRQMPSNLTEIVATFKGDLLKYMPTVGIDTVDEAVTFEVLHDDKTPFSPSFLFQAVRKHYTQPFKARSFDVDEYSRPDTEQDTVNLLDCIAGIIAKGDTSRIYFNPWREFDYLRMRGQLSDDISDYVQAAKNAINVERVRDFKRPLRDWTGADLNDLNARARHLAIVDWLRSCNQSGRKPSDILTHLMNEMQYQQLRKTC